MKYVDFEGQAGQFKRKDIIQNSVTAEVTHTLAYYEQTLDAGLQTVNQAN
jgi:hypothetical protein